MTTLAHNIHKVKEMVTVFCDRLLCQINGHGNMRQMSSVQMAHIFMRVVDDDQFHQTIVVQAKEWQIFGNTIQFCKIPLVTKQ